MHYDPAFAYEVSHIMQSGLRADVRRPDRRRTSSSTSPSTTSRSSQPKEPEDVDVEGILRGTAPGLDAPSGDGPRVQLLASGVGFPWINDAQRMLAEDWGVAADTWSVTSWNELARDAVAAEEWNLLHPGEEPADGVRHRQAGRRRRARSSRSRTTCARCRCQIARWVPGDYRVLGADGFGFADTRPAARRFFHIDAAVGRRAGAAGPRRRRPDRPGEGRRRRSTKYRIDDPTAVADVKQEGGDA